MNTTSDPGTLVVLDGLDGSGKTTLVQALSVELGGDPVCSVMSFPSRANVVGQLIREVFADPKLVCEEAMLYLFVADALIQQHTMRKHLDAGKIVICDRHPVTSGMVYNVTPDRHERAVADILRSEQFIRPDVVFVVDVPAEVAEARISARKGVRNPIYEKALEEKRARYLRLVSKSNGLVQKLDGTKSIEEQVPPLAALIRGIALHKTKSRG